MIKPIKTKRKSSNSIGPLLDGDGKNNDTDGEVFNKYICSVFIEKLDCMPVLHGGKVTLKTSITKEVLI